MEKLCNDDDRLNIKSVIAGLVEVGLDDDLQRLKDLTREHSEDEFDAMAQIALSYIKYAQDLKNELQEVKAAGYL